MSDWLKWDGGECPVTSDLRVDALLVEGDVVTDVAHNLDWRHIGLQGDIVKFRLAENK